jgi:hypothetical protein
MLQETIHSDVPLYAKIGCVDRETFTSTKLQLHVYTDNQCSQPYDDGQTSRRHATKGYDINGYIFPTRVSFRPPFYTCDSCTPDEISDTFNKANGNWYDDYYISQNGNKKNGNGNNNKNYNDDANGDDDANDAYQQANDDVNNGDDYYQEDDGGNKNDDGGNNNNGDDRYNWNDDFYNDDGGRRFLQQKQPYSSSKILSPVEAAAPGVLEVRIYMSIGSSYLCVYGAEQLLTNILPSCYSY